MALRAHRLPQLQSGVSLASQGWRVGLGGKIHPKVCFNGKGGGGLVVHDRYVNGVTDGGEMTPLINGLINR